MKGGVFVREIGLELLYILITTRIRYFGHRNVDKKKRF